MPVRIPQNQIQYNYTAGGKYIYATSYTEYIGYYYELNGKTFAGKQFNINAPELLQKDSDQVNKLRLDPKTATYAKISGVTLNTPKIISQPNNGSNKEDNISSRYSEIEFYCKNIIDGTIKRIDEDTYISLQKNPLYQVTYIGTYNNINQTYIEAEKQMPGLQVFIFP